jgi:aminoglycoside 6'-N-acetyltransferase I
VEAKSFLASDRLAFLATENEEIFGWIGAIRHTQLMWELHPLVVHPNHQGKGVGKALVQKLEAEALQQGVSTIWLGTDDDFGGTNIYGKNLYPDVLDQLVTLQPISSHPYTFYQEMGYSVVGVIPDASGFGKPDILMAKRIS